MQKLIATESYLLPKLNKYIDKVSFYRNQHQRDNKDLFFEGSPEGVFEIIIQSDNSVWQKESNESIWRQRDQAFVGGLHQQSFKLKLPPETEIMSVRFKHGTFKYIFNGCLNEFINQKVPLTELWSNQGKVIQNKLKEKLNRFQKVLLIADFLESKINKEKHSTIDQTVQSIIDCQGIIDIRELECHSNLSSAQFRKRFREEIGLPPKKFAKVIKLNAIISVLERLQGNAGLTDIAYEFGYFDQSHFIKDFKSVTGLTPIQYIQ